MLWSKNIFVVNLEDFDWILGMTWMKSLHEFTSKLDLMDLNFEHQGKKIVIRALLDVRLKVVSLR